MNKKNTRQKGNKGITLIALVITIIVMLILVAVTISMAVNGGLFEHAGQAVGKTNNALLAEQQLAEGGVEVDGEWYETIDEYLTKDQPKLISKETPYIGYYVDVDGDGEVDGWTYADAAEDSESTEGLKNYTISKEKVEGPIGEKEILKAVGSGDKRFHVISSADFHVGDMTTFKFCSPHTLLPGYDYTSNQEQPERNTFLGWITEKTTPNL